MSENYKLTKVILNGTSLNVEDAKLSEQFSNLINTIKTRPAAINSVLNLYVSPTGNDGTANGTREKPFFNIGACLQYYNNHYAPTSVFASGQLLVINCEHGTYDYNYSQIISIFEASNPNLRIIIQPTNYNGDDYSASTISEADLKVASTSNLLPVTFNFASENISCFVVNNFTCFRGIRIVGTGGTYFGRESSGFINTNSNAHNVIGIRVDGIASCIVENCIFENCKVGISNNSYQPVYISGRFVKFVNNYTCINTLGNIFFQSKICLVDNFSNFVTIIYHKIMCYLQSDLILHNWVGCGVGQTAYIFGPHVGIYASVPTNSNNSEGGNYGFADIKIHDSVIFDVVEANLAASVYSYFTIFHSAFNIFDAPEECGGINHNSWKIILHDEDITGNIRKQGDVVYTLPNRNGFTVKLYSGEFNKTLRYFYKSESTGIDETTGNSVTTFIKRQFIERGVYTMKIFGSVAKRGNHSENISITFQKPFTSYNGLHYAGNNLPRPYAPHENDVIVIITPDLTFSNELDLPNTTTTPSVVITARNAEGFIVKANCSFSWMAINVNNSGNMLDLSE